MHRIAAALLLALAALPLLPGTAHAWWNDSWSYRMRIVLDTGPKGADIAAPIGRVPVLVRLHSGNFNFATATENGTDIRFVAGDDKTPLHFHFEKFDGLIDQVALAWVDIPDLRPGAETAIYLYWGNKNAPNGTDAHATYDADQLLVWHFASDAGPAQDSTASGNNATGPVRRDHAGLIGNGALFDGSTTLALPGTASLAIAAGGGMTWSMWIRPKPGARTALLYDQRDGANQFRIGLDQGVPYAELATADGTQRAVGAKLPDGEAWHHLAITSGDQLTLTLDGVKQGSVAVKFPAMAGDKVLGGALPAATPPAASADQPATPTPAPLPTAAPLADFTGGIDEFEISRVARPEGAIALAAKSQGANARLLTFDVAEQGSVFGNGYIGIIVKSVTPDAWAVIGVLGVMMLISWLVMVVKVIFVSRQSGANRVFRREYAAVIAQMGDGRAAFIGLAQNRLPKLRRSPLFALYEVGASELAERVDNGRMTPDGGLAPQSIAAIRAALDARQVRETQRLNRLLVLLTIAISGGPFLGLLGTVVGVMITFAGVAQAGDVNINAIAPGISAALLATVAGLFVAIPALFGYNYLITRIRDLTADMRAFVDELTTRMAEGFRGTAATASATRQFLEAGE